MGGIFSSVINQGNVAGIQVQAVQPAVVDGLAYQIFFQAGGEYASIGDGKVWRNLKGSADTYTFSSGLEQSGTNVKNTLVTGKSDGNIIFGFDDDLSGSGLQLWSTSEAGIYSNYILFGSWNDNGTAYFSNTGAWNFGANTDPSLTTPYLYVFQSRGVFNARWDFNANIALLNTTGSHIQSAWQTNAPLGNANQTHLFFDSVGSPSFRIGTNNWFKLEPATLTTNRTFTLQNSDYTIAGINIAQTFSALQTFSAGATFGAAINATAGSAATTSINFGTANTGIYGDATSIRFSFAGNNRITFLSSGNVAFSGNLSCAQLQTGVTTFLSSSVSLTNGAGTSVGTLTNAPSVGNPTKWIPINDNGTTRYIPCW